MTSSRTHSAWHQNWRVKVEKPTLPSSSTRAYSSLTKKGLDNTNKEVKCALEVGENATPWGGLKRNCQPQTAPLSIKLMNFSPTTTSCHVWPALDYIIPLITSCILGFAHVLAVAEFKICQFFLETDSPNLISYPKFFSLETTFSISMPVCKESPYTRGEEQGQYCVGFRE